MLIKPPQGISVTPSKPFEHDALKRFPIAENLTELLKHVDEPFVLSINSSFGTGKTTFLQMWRQFLINDNFFCITFNAWENDFVADPLAALICELSPQLQKTQSKKLKTLYKKAKNAGIHVLKRSLPIVAKTLTMGGLDIDKEIEGSLASLSEEISKDIINNYSKQISAVKSFRESLEEYAKELSHSTTSATKRHPVIFFIDELDRCRPSFAVELLERVKHFFNIPGIAFILAYDKRQLESSIQTIFGHGIDIDGYMRRFVDLEYQLPRPSVEDYVRLLFKKYDLESYFAQRKTKGSPYDHGNLVDLFSRLFSTLDFSLRKQEQCFIELSIVIHTTPTSNILLPYILAPIIALRASNLELYRDFIHKSCTYKDIIKYFKSQKNGHVIFDDHLGAILEAHLAICNATEEEQVAYKSEYSVISGNEALLESERSRAKTIIELMISITDKQTITKLKYITDKLEFVSRFHDFSQEKS